MTILDLTLLSVVAVVFLVISSLFLVVWIFHLSNLRDDDIPFISSVILSLSVFPTYLVVGFGRMGIRLAKYYKSI